jgi:hypothetical protein
MADLARHIKAQKANQTFHVKHFLRNGRILPGNTGEFSLKTPKYTSRGKLIENPEAVIGVGTILILAGALQ